MARTISRWDVKRVAMWATAFAVGTMGDNVLTTSSFSNCNTSSSVNLQKVDITYNNDKQIVTFDIAGTSTEVQNVTAVLNVTAYGVAVYSNSFNPCTAATYVEQLCPVPSGSFSAKGTQAIPASYADMVPAIAFQVPDISATATLELKSLDTGENVGCITSDVTNGKTASVPAVSYIAAGIAGVALIASGVSAMGAAFSGAGAAGSGGGAGTASPSAGEFVGTLQGFAMNGMMSVNLPTVYRSFAKNFAFSTGLIPWTQMQESIDQFRSVTGGNLTNDSVQFLQNATLVWPDGSTSTADSSAFKRSLETLLDLATREIESSVNSTSTTSDNSTSTESTIRAAVSGIQGYVEELSVPAANTFMTVLLIIAIIIGVIVVGILLLKVILEAWALFGSFPKGLTGFRKHYWGSIARAITALIMLLYGMWVLYCIYQFTHGDSWAAKTLAGVTLALFTGVLAFFSYKIWSTARKLKNAEGDSAALYLDKDIWVKYSLFYESYKKDYWWLFVPAIVYMFAKGCVLAVGDGNGLGQTIAQLVVEACMMLLLLWSRPFERKASNVVNIMIQVVRVLSVILILVFVEELGFAETTQTITGVVLIVVQSVLTGLLAILIVWNAIVAFIKENPHRKRRKEMEKLRREQDTLTPLDARNSLLLDRKQSESSTFSLSNIQESKQPLARNASPERYLGAVPERANPYAANDSAYDRSITPVGGDQSRVNLVSNAAPIGRQPALPSVGGYGQPYSNGGYSNVGYNPNAYQSYRAPSRNGY